MQATAGPRNLLASQCPASLSIEEQKSRSFGADDFFEYYEAEKTIAIHLYSETYVTDQQINAINKETNAKNKQITS